MKKIILLSVVTSSLVLAGAYKVPEQSVNSMALGAAYVAHTDGADTAYFNPANMAFMEEKQFTEAGLTLAHLPRNEFKGDNPATSGKSEIENLILPNIHYVSNAIFLVMNLKAIILLPQEIRENLILPLLDGVQV